MLKKITTYIVSFCLVLIFITVTVDTYKADAEVLPVTGNPSVTEGKYKPLTNVPGLTTIGNFNDYINSIYALSIAIAGLLAVVKIIIAGVKWMTSDIVTNRTEAKKDIQGAVFGLLVVLGAVIILNTINKNLTETNLDYSSSENKVGVDVVDTVTKDIDISGKNTITIDGDSVYALKKDSEAIVKTAFNDWCLSEKNGLVYSGKVPGSNIEVGPRCIVGETKALFDTQNNRKNKTCTKDTFQEKVIWCKPNQNTDTSTDTTTDP